MINNERALYMPQTANTSLAVLETLYYTCIEDYITLCIEDVYFFMLLR